jgi:serine-type D-Ala-D-Ala carboxypeptidase/endopeptidase (penicillin-binding protein 4)
MERPRPLLAFILVATLGVSACTASSPRATPSGRTGKPPHASRPSPEGARPVVQAPVASAPPARMDISMAPWTRAIAHMVGARDVSVAVGVGGRIVFEHRGSLLRLPASNEKLLTSMTALSVFGPRYRFPTAARSSARPRGGVLNGDLWLVGAGDPELSDADLVGLAEALRAAGVRRITGSVLGDTSAFNRGWWAPGWIPRISRAFVTRPTALALDGNVATGSPERAAASSLTRALRLGGVRVEGAPRAGAAPNGLKTVAAIRSAPLSDILARQNHGSINFDAEMITKALGARTTGRPGNTAAGAAAIEAWVRRQGIRADVLDGSGLSHDDRISAAGIVRLLLDAEGRPWRRVLWASLAGPGEGTLAGRLAGLPVRAKTGTLFVTPASALSGYVRSADGRRVAFSVISLGLDKLTAVGIEDGVVRILTGAAVG